MNEDEALVEKQKAKALEARQGLEMKSLGGATGGLLEKLRPKVSDYKATKSALPPFGGWKKRRFFCAQGKKGNKTAMWVDDDCFGMHVQYESHDGTETYLGRSDWHDYQDGRGYPFVLRCPRSLSPEEFGRIHVDEPPGRWRAVLREYVRSETSGRAPQLEPGESLE